VVFFYDDGGEFPNAFVARFLLQTLILIILSLLRMCTGWPNATDGGQGWSNHNVSLAAYLVAASEFSYFSSGLHWFDLIPGTTEKAWPAWPDFRFQLGPPRGPRTRDGFVFRRSFEHADVMLDCGTITARINWRA
jgi:hypothetical protein